MPTINKKTAEVPSRQYGQLLARLLPEGLELCNPVGDSAVWSEKELTEILEKALYGEQPAPKASAPAAPKPQAKPRQTPKWLNLAAFARALTVELGRKKPLSPVTAREIIKRHDEAPGNKPVEQRLGELNRIHYESAAVPVLAAEYRAFWAAVKKGLSERSKARYKRGELKIIPRQKGQPLPGAEKKA